MKNGIKIQILLNDGFENDFIHKKTLLNAHVVLAKSFFQFMGRIFLTQKI